MIGIEDGFTRRLLVEAGLRPGMRVLDVGCGTGDVASMVADLVGEAGHVVGLDRDAGALATARARTGHRPGMAFVSGDVGSPPSDLGPFDAVVGRRVLMYQPDAIGTLRGLAGLLVPGGVMAFQEHDATLGSASLPDMPLHRQAQGWLRDTVTREGADPHVGLNLYGAATQAGLLVESLRAEAIVQTPGSPYPLADIVRAVLPRILAAGVATAGEIDIGTLDARLAAERAHGTYVGDLKFGLVARAVGAD